MKVTVDNPEQFVKKAFFLLWQAVGHTTGMGMFQNHPDATEEEVFASVTYPKGSKFYGDYVFGRMMKWGCEIKDGIIDILDKEFRHDYQGFSHAYADNQAVGTALMKGVGER